jgi:predicted nucleic acid-binding Zn ribbon protein
MPHSTGWERRKDRRSGDPAPIGEIVDGLLREQVFARGMAVGRLAAMWNEVMGDRLGPKTAPASLEDGVLTVTASDPVWGVQARFLHEEIRRKVNEALGSDAVREVRIVIGAGSQNRR